MKKTSLLFFGLLTLTGLSAQDQQDVEIAGESVYIRCSNFFITKPLRELAQMQPFDESKIEEERESVDEHDRRVPPQKVNPNALPLDGNDPIAQTQNGTMQPPRAPIQNWMGMSGSGYPPDPTGAAGPNHYVQAVNTSYRVYNKTGTGLANAVSLSTLWSGSSNDGDPIVLYDKYADRWFISQFQSSGNKILIAISQTSDPLGAYYAYTFIPVSNVFPDYPKYSIWSDGYYMSANYGNTKRLIAYERTKMLAGDPGAGMIVKSMTGVPSNNFFVMLPGDADGVLPPNGTPCYFFCYEDDAWSSGTTDQIRVYKMACDWTTGTATASLDAQLPTQAFNASFSSNWTDIPQPGSSQKLDAIGGVLNYRAQYREWTGYSSVVICHAVWVNQANAQAGVRWYELRKNGSGTWSIYQQGTYAPDTDSRWLGSIAMDDYGNIGLAYAVSSTSTSPSLRYTGRLSTDPLGQMTLAEQTAITGSGAQSGIERYGDYSHTSLDPDGVTFWHTGEYIASGSKKTRIFSWRISSAVGVEENEAASAKFNVFRNENQFVVRVSDLKSDQQVQVDLFDIQGRLIGGQKVTPAGKSFQTYIDASGLASGVYMVRIGNVNFQKVIKIVFE